MIEPQFGKARSGSVKGSSRASSSSHSSNTRTSDIGYCEFIRDLPSSVKTGNTVEASAVSRPTTPTLPSFSQSAKVINVTINNNYSGASEVKQD